MVPNRVKATSGLLKYRTSRVLSRGIIRGSRLTRNAMPIHLGSGFREKSIYICQPTGISHKEPFLPVTICRSGRTSSDCMRNDPKRKLDDERDYPYYDKSYPKNNDYDTSFIPLIMFVTTKHIPLHDSSVTVTTDRDLRHQRHQSRNNLSSTSYKVLPQGRFGETSFIFLRTV